MLTLEHLSFQYDPEHVIFRDLNYSFAPSSITAITGPSGCGKTTLMNLLAGLLKPTSGSISGLPERISYIFQEPRLFPWMTAIENVTTVSKDKARAEEYLIAMQLSSDAFERYPHELSGGMKQRVSIARALAWESQVFLMDEPFKGLDEATKAQTAKLLFDSIKGKTGILITHDPADLSYCDQILDLHFLLHTS